MAVLEASLNVAVQQLSNVWSPTGSLDGLQGVLIMLPIISSNPSVLTVEERTQAPQVC